MNGIAAISSLAFAWRDRRAVEPAAFPLYAVVAIEAAVVFVALASGRFVADGAMLAGVLGDSASIALLALAMRWIGFPRCAAFLEITAIAIASALLAAAASLVLASSALPLVDGPLAAIDRVVLGFDRGVIAAIATDHPGVEQISLWTYNSVAISVQFVMIGLLWRYGARATLRFALALQLATLISILVMPLFPAYGTPPYPYAFAEVLAGVRDGSIRTIDSTTLTGIVTFPSMHAAGGALLAWGFTKVGRIAAPFVVLNVLVVLSAITSGGHYLIDVGAGLGIAIAARGAARRLIPNAPPRSSPSAA